jgi:type IV secretion system T-DNA border endonuclease VirD2
MGDFDPKEFEPMGIILRIPTRRKRQAKVRPSGSGSSGGDGGGGASRLARIVRKTPEVMVKITGRCRGFAHVREHLNYITRNGEIAAEGPDGSQVYGRGTVNEVAQTWWAQRGAGPGTRRSNSPETVNFMLSMPKNTDRDRFAQAAKAFADKAFGGNHDYLIADHRDTDHTHVHLTVRARGFDGTRLNPNKAELQMWREWMAHELRAKGIEAEATPRRARGVVTKYKNQAVKHLDMRGASRVQRAKVVEAVRQVSAGVDAKELPWETATREKQKEIRSAWTKLADTFQMQGADGVKFAAEIRRFVAEMPAVKTEREALRETVVEQLQKQRGRGGDVTER